jgi:hypothetical protein
MNLLIASRPNAKSKHNKKYFVLTVFYLRFKKILFLHAVFSSIFFTRFTLFEYRDYD